ncbi:hypothetical protein L2E82_38900 [Cichorium intybus]|uniref:Uncharacterized protein n=1 Tax=Cichorium intybus TaxID=13427 RepID=A0ACB9AHD5_CICIN|nr:hypothetical protein L2E82_38900 [Cichorium intybus]
MITTICNFDFLCITTAAATPPYKGIKSVFDFELYCALKIPRSDRNQKPGVLSPTTVDHIEIDEDKKPYAFSISKDFTPAHSNF